MDNLAYISKFTSLTPNFYFVFQKCMQQLTYQHYVHKKKPGYLNFFISKYGISLVQIHVGQLKIYKAWFGDIFQEAFHRDLSKTHSGLINQFCDSFGGYYIEFHILIAKMTFLKIYYRKLTIAIFIYWVWRNRLLLIMLDLVFGTEYIFVCLSSCED